MAQLRKQRLAFPACARSCEHDARCNQPPRCPAAGRQARPSCGLACWRLPSSWPIWLSMPGELGGRCDAQMAPQAQAPPLRLFPPPAPLVFVRSCCSAGISCSHPTAPNDGQCRNQLQPPSCTNSWPQSLAVLTACWLPTCRQSSPAVNGRPWTLRVSISGDAAAGDAAASAAVAQAGDADGLHLVAQEQQQVVDDVSQPHSAPATYQEAVAKCADQPDLACLTAASKLPLGKGQFRFPHAFIVGYQKSATTSLFATLIHHPDVLSAKIKVKTSRLDACVLGVGQPATVAQCLHEARWAGVVAWPGGAWCLLPRVPAVSALCHWPCHGGRNTQCKRASPSPA